MGIIHSFKYHDRKQGIPKAVTVTENKLLQDAAHTMLFVLSAMHFTAPDWKLQLVLSRTVLKIVVFQVIMSAAITMH